MASSTTSADADPTLVDYVQSEKWQLQDCSDQEQFQVSDSYAIGIVFHWKNGGYKTGKGKQTKLVDIAPSFSFRVAQFATGDMAMDMVWSMRAAGLYFTR